MAYLKKIEELRTICEEILEGKENPLSASPSVRCVTDAASYRLMTPGGDDMGHVFHYPKEDIFVRIERTKSDFSPCSSDRAYCDNGMFHSCDKTGCESCFIVWNIRFGDDGMGMDEKRVEKNELTSPHPSEEELTCVVDAIRAFAKENGVTFAENRYDGLPDKDKLLNVICDGDDILENMSSDRLAKAFDELGPVGKLQVLHSLLSGSRKKRDCAE